MSQSRAILPISQPEQQQIQPFVVQSSSKFEEIIAYLKRGRKRAIKQKAWLDALENQNVSTQAQMQTLETQVR